MILALAVCTISWVLGVKIFGKVHVCDNGAFVFGDDVPYTECVVCVVSSMMAALVDVEHSGFSELEYQRLTIRNATFSSLSVNLPNEAPVSTARRDMDNVREDCTSLIADL